MRHNRVNGILEPTRSIGDIDMKISVPSGVIAAPEVTQISLDGVSRWMLILGSDGFWDYVTVPSLLASLPGPVTSDSQAKAAAAKLVAMAVDTGSGDDVTLLLAAGGEKSF